MKRILIVVFALCFSVLALADIKNYTDSSLGRGTYVQVMSNNTGITGLKLKQYNNGRVEAEFQGKVGYGVTVQVYLNSGIYTFRGNKQYSGYDFYLNGDRVIDSYSLRDDEDSIKNLIAKCVSIAERR